MLSMYRWSSRSIVVLDRRARRRRRARRAPASSRTSAAPGVHLDVPHALGAAERVVVLLLQPRLPDDGAEPRAGKALRVEIVLGDLADVAHEVGDRLAGRDRAASAPSGSRSPGSTAGAPPAGRWSRTWRRRTRARAGSGPGGSAGRSPPTSARVERHEAADAGEHRAERVGRRREQLDRVARARSRR